MNNHYAFIGLGNMGLPMAKNLLKNGCHLSVFDLVDTAMDELVAHGAVKAESAVAAVDGADVVISMLPAGTHVQQLYLGEQGLQNKLSVNTLVIDCSTIDSHTAKTVGQALAKNNIKFIDAPVSGGVGGAAAGTLTFIVGGDKAHFDMAKPILEHMGKNIFHAGDLGAGQVAKICNNMLLSVLMTATAEAIQMGVDNGLDPKVLSDIMLQSSGRNWTLELYNPCPNVMENVPASKNYQGGFMVDLMKKDLGLAMETASNSKSITPMGALANSLYKMHSAQGHGQLDFSSIFKLFQH
ncbi:3-hydroxyisobutyrate dehydrogenase [Alteromonadaceae bacterium BrNp21-10]|nr:3-hydroxyisobutyrate dehydrogenase [Alteromonadaceae bacterium BrNp21-10]